jgi:hypothetical protein
MSEISAISKPESAVQIENLSKFSTIENDRDIYAEDIVM